MDGIIPASGYSTRMRGMPKFLLPADDEYKTLLEIHIDQLSEVCDEIYLSTRPELVPLIESLNFENKNLNILSIETNTMSETVLKTIEHSESQSFMLVMPDTYFYGDQPYHSLNSNPKVCELACWEIRDEQRGKLGEVLFDDNLNVLQIIDKKHENGFQHAWGALTFSRKLLKYINISDPHIGYAVKSALLSNEMVSGKIYKGEYYDCGTPSEYLDLLSKILLK